MSRHKRSNSPSGVWAVRSNHAGTSLRSSAALGRVGFCALALPLLCCWGCTGLPKDESGVRYMKEIEPETGAEYYLAVPSKHDPKKKWTLVVTCHGTPPWDTALQQIGRWGSFAEGKGFVVVAPVLKGTASDNPFISPDVQIRRQEHDERVILSLVERLRPAFNIDPTRVFLTGWSGGAYAVLYTGLRHPDIFRALAVHQGNFDERFVKPTLPRLDPYQPVQISWGITDLLKDDAEEALHWIRSHRMAYAIPQELAGHHRLLPEVAYRFFRRVVREHPWMVVTAFASRPDNLMAVKFRVRSAPSAETYLWQFGDGDISPAASPEHVYSEPGEYRVQVTIKTAKGRQHVRTIKVRVPVAQIGVASGGR